MEYYPADQWGCASGRSEVAQALPHYTHHAGTFPGALIQTHDG